MQVVVDGHETASSSVDGAPGGSGVYWSVHLVPFQRSANVTQKYSAPPTLQAAPTAVQAFAAGQATPYSRLQSYFARYGVVWIVQLLPFHRSASGMQAVPVRLRPTAVQAAAEEHETPSSRLPC